MNFYCEVCDWEGTETGMDSVWSAAQGEAVETCPECGSLDVQVDYDKE